MVLYGFLSLVFGEGVMGCFMKAPACRQAGSSLLSPGLTNTCKNKYCLRPGRESHPRMEDLQSPAFLLRHQALYLILNQNNMATRPCVELYYIKTRETGPLLLVYFFLLYLFYNQKMEYFSYLILV